MNQNLVFYVLTVVIFSSLFWFVLNQGAKLENGRHILTSMEESHQETSGVQRNRATAQESALLFFFWFFLKTRYIRSVAGCFKSGEVVEKILEVELAPG